ncbi:ornithine carbamoyltransferase [Aerococcus suis]|uniref:Ornithine carbamoyltransferase n=1 Tax=Aerococcus suis TaxID=371602 RepID=A0A1W1Z0I9_9LACT|nr:ornithine carbamoyltransferase [Aerococcus suis]MCI7240730.1 ornithine carbamoyltransferase [Aerococcus suis]MDD7758518.1 ornithine carbamoyltransferase [Aerococcus suis]MDY4646195.1 ornithine carbamoyltransferase [Aerococcus suis]SMC41977.1 ornithine carbamoyltransferase [Aerococcus suis]
MFQGRSLLKEVDFTREELEYLIDFGIHLKDLKKRNIPHEYLKGQNIALLFEKSSTRTRSAFTVACNDLGANPEFMGAGDIQLGKKESVEDTAKVFGSMFDGIEFRGFKQDDVEMLAKYSGVPVWNGLTDEWHPTQMIADFMTVKEEFGELQGKKLVYCGDGRNNIANSLVVTGSMLGVDITIASPKELFPEKSVIDYAEKFAKESGSTINVTEDIKSAVKDADVLYTDVWVSMGEEDKFEERINLLKPYQVNKELTDLIEGDYIFLHCLPSYHDIETKNGKEMYEKFGVKEMEVTDEVFRDEKHARQFEEAENRMHSIKAIMAATNGNLFIPKV